MAEHWTLEQIEIERRREKRRAENMVWLKLAGSIALAGFICAAWTYLGYQVGHSQGFMDGYALGAREFRESLQ